VSAVSRARARKGRRVSSIAKRRASHGGQRGGASRRCRPAEKKGRARPPVADEGGDRRLSGAPHRGVQNDRGGRSVRGVSAGAEPSAEQPEARQSECSDVCRDQAREKYLQPEGRACRREAVVRPAPEAGREPLGADGRGCESPSGRRAARPRRRLQPRGRAGE
jgi:hypothetical protein